MLEVVVMRTKKKEKDQKRMARREFLKDSTRVGTGALAFYVLSTSRLGRGIEVVSTGKEAPKATLFVDAAALQHRIDPQIYGTFIEHFGRCIYGGVYEAGSPLSDEEGFRKDVLAATREWRVPILRWPGGGFSSSYHWQDGIGPQQTRPRKYDVGWFKEESNQVGTDEFIGYCRKLGAEPYICVNLGTGSIEEAANWVEYCNGTGNTYYANRRRQNGHAEPYNVRYWGLGNEIDLPWFAGHKSAEDYAKVAFECAKLMKWTDPTIRLVACGSDYPENHWNRIVLEKLIDVVDYISSHNYEGTDDYYELLGSVQHIEERLRLLDAAIELTAPLAGKDRTLALSLAGGPKRKRIEIACDEWNIWYRKMDIWRRAGGNPLDERLEERYNLRDALWTASVLNLFHRMANKVTMANISMMVNVLGTMFTNGKGMFLQTIYFPIILYRQHCGSVTLGYRLECPTFSSKSYKDLPYLDVSPTLDPEHGRIALAVVNRHRSAPITTSIAVQNARVEKQATVLEINGWDPDTENSFEHPDNVKIATRDYSLAGDKFQYVFPAHSVTLIDLSAE
jgi:alpha-N-arabinofuranosidase